MPQSTEEALQSSDSQSPSSTTALGALAVPGADAIPVDNTAGKPEAQDQTPQLLDPAFEIRKETTAHLAGAAAKDAAPPTDVAFAARIAERATSSRVLGLRSEQQSIAASRFDATGPTAPVRPEDRAAFSVSPDVPVNPGAEADADASRDSDVSTHAAGIPEIPAPLKNAAVDAVPKATHAQRAQLAADTPSSPGYAVRSKDEPGNGESTTEAPPASHATSASHAGSGSSQIAASVPGPTTTAPAASMITNAHLRENGTGKTALDGAAPQTSGVKAEGTGSRGEAVRDISLRLSTSNQASVQVRLSERAGELHVSVRTPDTGLSRGLRDSLPDLVERLQVSGYRAETWQPEGNSFSSGQDRGHDAHGDSSQNRDSGGSGSFSQQSDQQGRRQGEEQPPEWRHELESTLQRSNKVWQPSPTL